MVCPASRSLTRGVADADADARVCPSVTATSDQHAHPIADPGGHTRLACCCSSSSTQDAALAEAVARTHHLTTAVPTAVVGSEATAAAAHRLFARLLICLLARASTLRCARPAAERAARVALAAGAPALASVAPASAAP